MATQEILKRKEVTPKASRLTEREIMKRITAGKVTVVLDDGTKKTAGPEDFPGIFSGLWKHVDGRIEGANLMNAADNGPGGFKGYPLHSQAADLMNNGKWDDLIAFENHFDTFYTDTDCPYRS